MENVVRKREIACRIVRYIGGTLKYLMDVDNKAFKK